MAEVIWTRRAALDVIAIRNYVAEFNPSAARRLSNRLISAAESLEQFANRGRLTEGGYRELTLIPPYIIRYRVAGERVIVVEIRHSAQG
ncbi:type II toxin-antitoxin system mRNA interferase toxin, RelE/StbE family [Pseudomonas sp. ODNR1LW]|nr:type II toxin-antitoxin system mRNA interferase toxin, RelE/StbE family [Pseudomonas sp. ODNR1LW]